MSNFYTPDDNRGSYLWIVVMIMVFAFIVWAIGFNKNMTVIEVPPLPQPTIAPNATLQPLPTLKALPTNLPNQPNPTNVPNPTNLPNPTLVPIN